MTNDTIPTPATAGDLAIEATGLVKHFGNTRAVNGVDLAVPTGSVYGVLGPNGAGKTTTVSMLATLLRPDAGSAKVFGYDVVADAVAVRSLVGVTGQYASVDEDLTALQNLMLFARLLGFSRARARSLCAEMHAGFGALRSHCPMNIEAALPETGALIWRDRADVRVNYGWKDGVHTSVVARKLVKPGDVVLVDDPGYPNLTFMLRFAGAHTLGAPAHL